MPQKLRAGVSTCVTTHRRSDRLDVRWPGSVGAPNKETEKAVTDMMNESSAGPSVWERELYAHLTTHVEAEQGLLEEYRAAAEASSSKALRYLVDLLIQDEIRHHRIFVELADSLKAEALMMGTDPIIPVIDFGRGKQNAVIDLTERLLEKERQDEHDLKTLHRQLRDVKDTTLWDLLVDLMERDTQKHIAILRFARKHAGRRTKE